MFSASLAKGQCDEIDEKLTSALADLGAGRRAEAWVEYNKLLDAPTVKDCDDGYIAEGISDLAVRLLSEMPDGLPRLAEVHRVDEKRYFLILKHLDGTASCDNLLNLNHTLQSNYGTTAALSDVRKRVLVAIKEASCLQKP